MIFLDFEKPIEELHQKIQELRHVQTEESALDILKSSGADLVTKEYFLLNKYDREKCLILPSNYFYPWPNFLLYPNLNIRDFITDKTIGIHYWEVSWTKGNLLKRAFWDGAAQRDTVFPLYEKLFERSKSSVLFDARLIAMEGMPNIVPSAAADTVPE